MAKLTDNLTKTIFSKFMILGAFFLSQVAFGQEPEFQSRIQESQKAEQLGLAPRLTDEELAAYSNWADQAVSDLEEVQKSVKSVGNPRIERDTWVSAIKKIVPQAPMEKDTLFRWALNRALRISQILESAKSAGLPANIDQEVRVLRKSAELALAFANRTLLKNQDAVTDLPFQVFAIAEADALLWIDENELDTPAQLQIALEVLGWMHVDLWRDPQSKDMAHPIVRIENFLKEADDNHHPVSMYEIRTLYFDTLTELKDGGTRVGEKIKETLVKEKTTNFTKKIHNL